MTASRRNRLSKAPWSQIRGYCSASRAGSPKFRYQIDLPQFCFGLRKSIVKLVNCSSDTLQTIQERVSHSHLPRIKPRHYPGLLCPLLRNLQHAPHVLKYMVRWARWIGRSLHERGEEVD